MRFLVMNAKEYLRQAMLAERLLRSKMEQLARLESMATAATQRFDSTGGTHSTGLEGSKLENSVVGIVDMKDQIREQTTRLVKLRKDISDTIASVENLTHQYILEERYLNYKEWHQIQYQTGFSLDYLYKLHRSAISTVQRILDSR